MRFCWVRLAVSLAAVLAFGAVASADALHGFCVSPTPTCSDNGTITPVSSNSPHFGFWDASGPVTGADELAFLIPTNKDGSPSFTFTVNITNGGPSNNLTGTTTASLFSLTPWTSGQLDAYLGLSASPTNPIGNYVPDPLGKNTGVTGYYVYTANVSSLGGSTTVQPQATMTSGPLFTVSGLPSSVGGSLPQSSFILDFVTPVGAGTIATANSGALGISTVPTPEPGTLLLFGTGMLGIAGIVRKRLSR